MTFLALEKLIKTIEERKNAEVDHSYTASLLGHKLASTVNMHQRGK